MSLDPNVGWAARCLLTKCIGGYEGASAQIASQIESSTRDDLLQPGPSRAGH